MSRILYTASTARHINDFHLDVLDGLKDAGFEVVAACRDAYSLPSRFSRLEIPFSKSFFAPENIKALRVLYRLLKKDKFDIVSTHTALAGFVTRAALILLGTERPFCVHTAHGYLFGRSAALSGRATYPFERLCRSVTDVIMTMNKEDNISAQKLVKRGGTVVSTDGMGVDIQRFSPPETGEKERLREKLHLPEGFLIFCAAEFSARKNHKTIIYAMPEILRVRPDARLLLAGDGALLEKTQKLALEQGVSERVLFLGRVPDTAPYLKASDMAVSASLSEGLPLGIMEAVACAVPVAASRVKGHTDMLGGSNALFDPRSPRDAAACCAEIVRKYADYVEFYSSRRSELTISRQEAAAKIIQFYIKIKINT